MDLAATRWAMPVSDYGAARLLVEEWDGGISYASPSNTWYLWDRKCLRRDDGGLSARLVHHLGARLREMLEQAKQWLTWEISRAMPGSPEAEVIKAVELAWKEWEAAVKYAHKLAANAGATALLGYLAGQAGCADEDMNERHPGWLNLDNGTLDLETSELRRPECADRITYCLPLAWNRQAGCPQFWSLLRHVAGENMDVARYLVKLLGYSLLGDNREQVIVFIAGPTASGKSKLLHIVAEVLGPLAHVSQSDLICVVRHGQRNARRENSIRGVRFVAITETSRHLVIDEAQLKRLTGEPVIGVDQHYSKREIETRVTYLIWVATNNMPTLTNYDEALRRRIIVLPGGASIPEHLQDELIDKKILEAEREGILNLLIWGCQLYLAEHHLEMPDAVRFETERYAIEQNTVANFMADTMVYGTWGWRGNGIPQHQAWEQYDRWARGGGKLTRNEFLVQMGSQPGVSWNRSSRRFEGVIWNDEYATKIV